MSEGNKDLTIDELVIRMHRLKGCRKVLVGSLYPPMLEKLIQEAENELSKRELCE